MPRDLVVVAFGVVLIAGVILGFWHSWLGGCFSGVLDHCAVFVLRTGDPPGIWVWAFAGPFSTLPAVALAIFSRRLAGT